MTTQPSAPASATPPASPAQRRRLGELLVTAKLISPELRNQALDEARKQKMRLGQYLVLQKVIKEIHLVKAISYQLKVEMFNPQKHAPDPALRELLPRSLAEQRHLCPLFRLGSSVHVAMLDPTDVHAVDDVVFATGLDVEPLICTRAQLTQLQEQLYGPAPQGAAGMPAPAGSPSPVRSSEGGLVLAEAIDMDAIQPPGAFASPQGLAAGRGDMTARFMPGTTASPLDLEALAISGALQEMAQNTGATLSPNQPTLELADEAQAREDGLVHDGPLPVMEVLAVEEVVPVEDVVADCPDPTGALAGDPSAAFMVRDAGMMRRIQTVAGGKYDREEVIRAALMLGLAVLEEEPGLVAALNMQTRDPWR